MNRLDPVTSTWNEYDPWGNGIYNTSPFSLSFGYAGYYYDSETGLYYLKIRYYSSVLGRFLTRDDTKYVKDKDPITLNLYQYALDNPVSNTDPTGEDPPSVDWNGTPVDINNPPAVNTNEYTEQPNDSWINIVKNGLDFKRATEDNSTANDTPSGVVAVLKSLIANSTALSAVRAFLGNAVTTLSESPILLCPLPSSELSNPFNMPVS